MALTIEDMATFCKAKGFVYPNSEIYNGNSGFFDYGPLGTELKNNIKSSWWKRFVQSREDVAGIDGAIISHPKVWKASGHVDCFSDKMIYCKKHKKQFRADQIVEDVLKTNVDGVSADDLLKMITDNPQKFVEAGYELADEISDFNLMFKTYVGPSQSEENVAYLRPETAQLIFTNFKAVFDTMRMSLPFGIAQVGKAFRNEISPRDFLFRCREFEQMEIEFFIHPDEKKCTRLTQKYLDFTFNVLSEDLQNTNKPHITMTLGKMLDSNMADEWHLYWLKEVYQWFLDMGINPENLRLREHLKDELAHYSSACFDIEYKFPFGWKEIHGNANRGQFDLQQHSKFMKKGLEIFDEATKTKIIPRVIEPSQGLDRAFLAILYDAYQEDTERGNIVLKLHPNLVPIQIGIFPLVNKLNEKAREIYESLRFDFICQYDKSGSIGRRYARADEQGVPIAITVDFETLDNSTITLRDRDSTKQIRLPLEQLNNAITQILAGKKLEELGKLIE